MEFLCFPFEWAAQAEKIGECKSRMASQRLVTYDYQTRDGPTMDQRQAAN